MTSTVQTGFAAAARLTSGAAPLWGCIVAAAVAFASAVHANPGPPAPDADHDSGMYGDPAGAARYWHQQQWSDCGEMAVADVAGELTSRQPTESQITAVAEHTPSTVGSGPMWRPVGNTDIRDLPALLWHYWITADNVQTTTAALEQALAEKRKVIALVNAETIWRRPGNRAAANHFVVVTGIDTKDGVVHLNDSGIKTGRDERVALATFEQAWAPNHNSAIVTRTVKK
ncbi:hypothetical protein [Mycobacterium shigaense]|uniref:Peptidase C39-like domain-containing protein n=1 Tax=Mycobacterium shigaense TaxID=722731 RepID=A0A1Z4EHY7_9MYCO|nr:hypothetical protein [Mycobacterium shigaense]MEA1123748.1 hypothetical protein [Mycobacterium shigaense]BAX92579.1 hypothetical protein MSG_02435 [Mycobacterium shigaense]